jgi:CBS domain-containing protein
MRARELMTVEVATVTPETTRQDIARLLLARGISAVPVVDRQGVPVGMVSEGDLIGRAEPERKLRRDWWLAMLAEGEALSEEYVASLGGREATARDLMTAPVITVDETTEVEEIATLLASYRIKRVPVLRDGRLVGIVSRADLLRVLSPAPHAEPHEPGRGPAGELGPLRLPPAPAQVVGHAPTRAGEAAISAADFRHLAGDYEHLRQLQAYEARKAQALRRRAQVKELIDHHIGEQSWQAMLHRAREAAEHGEREHLLLRFPSELCTDGGRAINSAEPDWPASLRGEAAEIYLRWKRELKPREFGLGARIMDFPDGKPGDVGLFLIWGE